MTTPAERTPDPTPAPDEDKTVQMAIGGGVVLLTVVMLAYKALSTDKTDDEVVIQPPAQPTVTASVPAPPLPQLPPVAPEDKPRPRADATAKPDSSTGTPTATATATTTPSPAATSTATAAPTVPSQPAEPPAGDTGN